MAPQEGGQASQRDQAGLQLFRDNLESIFESKVFFFQGTRDFLFHKEKGLATSYQNGNFLYGTVNVTYLFLRTAGFGHFLEDICGVSYN